MFSNCPALQDPGDSKICLKGIMGDRGIRAGTRESRNAGPYSHFKKNGLCLFYTLSFYVSFLLEKRKKEKIQLPEKGRRAISTNISMFS